MGKSILTPTQHRVFTLALNDSNITDWFYFTGGTALSEFYLHHRLSEDLDFFSEDKIHEVIVDQFMDTVAEKENAIFTKVRRMGHFIYTLKLPKNEELKIDFVYQPYKPLEQGMKYKKLTIASKWDITIDKLYTIFHRIKSRDFIDLYFLFNEEDYDFNLLMAALEEKYSAHFDQISLLSRLPVVKDLVDFPTMLVPFDKKEMENFYLDLVKKMEKKLFK